MSENFKSYLKFILQLLEIALVWWVALSVTVFVFSKTDYPVGEAAYLLGFVLVVCVYSFVAVLDYSFKDTRVMNQADTYIRDNQDAIFMKIRRIFIWIINSQTCFFFGKIASFIFDLIIIYKRRKK